ncbi:neuropeptide Y receptor type 2 [Nothobranchius furzeri]|uniref:Transcript variant X1 n=5 Tax=Nothobranchius TaxID=28779 RepID=A0A1A8B1I3_NOTFU|nr:neuropeptide Y receptor type 2 [Nothobranchius furzeri]XP_054599602.1 neuropeptide Y receptor type 2 [Nothobranchius furzeri]XP_054599603.1 neuropeptide Y receptor type 2 [Nothobranchius furzeri]KAF7198824.1 transcript variant X1 [Nothobranchius furzeri]KAF7198825.1 transcript variant X2 [Nothobranchius furzeri]
MDWSQKQHLGLKSSFPPLQQEKLNHTFSFHSALMLMSTLDSPTVPLRQPLPSSHPPYSSLISFPALSTASSSALNDPTSFPLILSNISSNDLADLEKMLLWTLHEPSTIALTIMYCLSFILGFVGNLMALRVLTSRRSRRLAGVSATRNLLVNLAACDLAVVCVCMPITLGNQIYTTWVYGDLLCRAVPFTQAMSVSASVLTLTVISVNRYYSVRSPLRARSMFTRRRILVTIAVVWTVSSMMCAPIAVMNRRQEISFETFTILVCQEEWPRHRLKQGYNVLLFVMLYCLPVTFNLTISFLTGRRLWGGRKSTFADLDPRSQALHTSRLKTRQKIAKMVVCLVLLFAVSWLPLYLVDLWIDCEQQPSSWLLQTRPFAQWLGLTNSSLNPICYCFIGDLYRSAKVIRTRYYQKVAALFSTSSFSSSAAVVSPAAIITETKGISVERHHLAAAVATSTSVVTIPRLLGLARHHGHKVRHSLDSDMGSDHSISDWCQSSPSVCDSSLYHCQLHTLHHSLKKTDSMPARRHSVNEIAVSLPLRIEPVEMDLLPQRRHSEERIYGLPPDKGEIISKDRDRFCYIKRHRSKTSQLYFLEGNSENKTTDMTSL